MIRNYIKVALRSLVKGRLYSVINILGLSVGIGVCYLIMLFVTDEYAYDKFHQNADRIHRAWVKEHFKDQLLFNTVTPVILGPELQNNFPGIESMTRIVNSTSMARKDAFFEQEQVTMVDPEFLKVFDFDLLEGNRTTCLNELHDVLITPSVARKYFGETAPIGKTFELQIGGAWTTYRVNGILAEPPTHSSIQYDIVVPFENAKTFLSDGAMRSWTIIYVETYVLLDEGVDADALTEQIAPFVDEKVADSYDPGQYIVGLQPLTDIHLNPDFPVGLVQVSDKRYIYILSGVSLLILLLACINFTTIAIGRSVTRAKEVGIRKVTGATRIQIMSQFWSEAILTTFIAVVLGLFLSWLVLPLFNTLSGKSMAFAFGFNQLFWLVGLVGITGMLAGIYPSLVLSRYSPMQVMRGVFGTKGGDRHVVLRWLVGVQYIISIVLIICTLIVQQQVSYLQDKDLGYSDEQVVAVPYQVSGQRLSETWSDAKQISNVLRQDLVAYPEVTDISTTTHAFGSQGWFQVGYVETSTDRFRQFTVQQIEPNYVEMMELDLIDGRDFHTPPDADLNGVIINEAMAAAYGWDQPVGQPLPEPFQEWRVIGVARDFHFSSLYDPIDPLVMTKDVFPIFRAASDHSWNDAPNPKFLFKLSTSDLPATLATLQKAWTKAVPEHTFNYTFLDEQTARQYESEVRLSSILKIATGLAIFIACMGLFGIGVLTTARRTKEVGVRRVLGASTLSIIMLLNKPYSILVMIGAALAIPAAWYISQSWLEGFAYRTAVSPMIFVLAVILGLLLAWIAVGYQSIRAARSNPAQTLRDE